MDYKIEITGVKELLNKLQSVTRQDVINESLNDSASFFVATVKETRLRGPRPFILGIKTGRLIGSISRGRPQKVGDSTFVEVGTNVEYAPIHEFGLTVNKISKRGKAFSVHYPKRPFFKPVAESAFARNTILNIFVKNINKALEK